MRNKAKDVISFEESNWTGAQAFVLHSIRFKKMKSDGLLSDQLNVKNWAVRLDGNVVLQRSNTAEAQWHSITPEYLYSNEQRAFLPHRSGKCLRFYSLIISVTLYSLNFNDFLSGKEPHLAMQIYNEQWQLSDLRHLVKILWTVLERIVLLGRRPWNLRIDFFGNKYSKLFCSQCVYLKSYLFSNLDFFFIFHLSNTRRDIYMYTWELKKETDPLYSYLWADTQNTTVSWLIVPLHVGLVS